MSDNLGNLNLIDTYYIVSTQANQSGCFPNSTMALCYAPTNQNINITVGTTAINLNQNQTGFILANNLDQTIPYYMLNYYKFNVYQDNNNLSYIVPFNLDGDGNSNKKLLTYSQSNYNYLPSRYITCESYNCTPTIYFNLDFSTDSSNLSSWNQWYITNRFLFNNNDPNAFQIFNNVAGNGYLYPIIHLPNIDMTYNGTTYTSYSYNLNLLNYISANRYTQIFTNNSCVCGIGNGFYYDYSTNVKQPSGSWYFIRCRDNTYSIPDTTSSCANNACSIISTQSIISSLNLPSSPRPITTNPKSISTISSTIPIQYSTSPKNTGLAIIDYEIGGGVSLSSIFSSSSSSSFSLSCSLISFIIILLIFSIIILK